MQSLDQYNRVIRNLYTRVFEQGRSKQNAANEPFYRAAVGYGEENAIRYNLGFSTEVLRDRPVAYCKMTLPIDLPWSTALNSGSADGVSLGDHGLRTQDYPYNYINKIAGPGITPTFDAASRQFDAITDHAAYIQLDTYFVNDSRAGNAGSMTRELILYLEPGSYATNVGAYLSTVGDFFNSGAVSAFGVGIKNTTGSPITDNMPIYVRSSYTDGIGLTSMGTITIGEPHHIVLVRNARHDVRLYVDGVQLGSTLGAAGADFAGGGAYISTSTNSYLTVLPDARLVVDELAVYRHALTEDRIIAHYDAWQNGALDYPVGNAYFQIAPKARYYTALTAGGSNTSVDDSAYKFAAGVTISYTANVVDETQMWGAVCLRPDWAYTSPPTTPDLFRWQDDANNRLIVYYDTGTNQWVCRRLSGGAGANAVVNGSHAQYDDVVLCWYVTATQVAISLNGAAFVTTANSSIPTLSASTFNIGNGDNPSNAWYHWMVMGTGTLTDADAAAFYALGRYDPEWKDIPTMQTTDPSFLWHCYSAEHQPTSLWGEAIYA